MARKKNEDESEENKIVIASEKDLEKAFGTIDDLNEDAALLSESALSEVNDWISTDCYALNAIMSGSVHRGVPVGRVSVFYGLQSTGKTLIVNKIIANGQKKGYNRVAYFDSEVALDRAVAERLGCDITKIKHVPVEIIESCKLQILTLLNNFIAVGAKRKLIIVIDSLGNLSSEKEFSDIDKEKVAGDMGLRAKSLSSLMRMLTYRAAKAEAPVLCTNHVYENPSEIHPGMIKKQTGGLKPLYIASILVQLAVSNQKADEDKTGERSQMSDKVTGVTLRALTAKNRFVPPFLCVDDISINFRTGINKYRGLVGLANRYNILVPDGLSSLYEGKSAGRTSALQENAEFWENGPLQKLEEALQKDLTYSNEKYKDLKEEVDNIIEK